MWAEWLSVQPPIKSVEEGSKEEVRRERARLGVCVSGLSYPLSEIIGSLGLSVVCVNSVIPMLGM